MPSGVHTNPGGQWPDWQESMHEAADMEQAPLRHWELRTHGEPLRPRPAGRQTFAAMPEPLRRTALQPKPEAQPEVGLQRSMQIALGAVGSGRAQAPERQSMSVAQGSPEEPSPAVALGTQMSTVSSGSGRPQV
jgi:hypothetical protein